MWHMWIYLGSANANFYYAITLLFGAWQVRRLQRVKVFGSANANFCYAIALSVSVWQVLFV